MNRPEPPPVDAVLDADIVAALTEAISPLPMDVELTQRIKQRLLQRIEQDPQQAHQPQAQAHLTVRAEDGQWRPFGPGLTMKPLHQTDGIASYLLRLAPGAVLPAHRHPMDEECVVLEGSLRIGELHVKAGGFHLGRQDVVHAPIVSDKGALIYLRGATPSKALLV